ncbi:MAG TPA: PilN domain-containing protein [Candidatus Andersenbacteria bacterium]|nr:PilN domain-containing protein [Candidatus Andersenbacteria bacterium]
MPSINLAPGTQYIITARKRRVRLYSIAILIITIFFIWGIGLYVYTRILTATSNTIKTEIGTVNQKLSQLRDEATRVELFERRLVEISQLLDVHIGWDRVLAELERLLPADTILTSFSGASQSPTIQLEGATQNIDQVALVFASLTKDKNHPSLFERGSVKEIERQSQQTGDGPAILTYTFSMTLEFNVDALKKTAL